MSVRPLLVSLVALLGAGCATQPIPKPPVPFTALDARLDGTRLQVRYLGPEGLLYSSSELPETTVSPRAGGEGGEGGEFPVWVVEPSATAREPPDGPRSGRRVPVLGPDVYQDVLGTVIDAIVPRAPNTAVVVEMNGESAALFHDADGRFDTRIGEPPGGIEVVSRVRLADSLAAVPGMIARALEEQGIAAREVLLNTGEADTNPWPFVYVNLDAAAAVFVLTRPLDPVRHEHPPPAANPAWHVAKSHSIGVLQRPVSSLTRVLLMLTDTVGDTVTPRWTFAFDGDPVPALHAGPGMDLAAWEEELDRITGRTPERGTVKSLVDGEAFFTRLEEAIGGATDNILMRMYIFDNDDYAVHIADLLRERAAAGVDVRVLIDGLGSVFASTEPPAGLPEGYEPPASIQEYLKKDSTVRVRTILNPFGTSDHTKTVVIDDAVAFLGGMNIGREYRYEWHDAMVELNGPVITELADEFDAAWAGAGWLGDVGELLERLAPGRGSSSSTGYPVRVLYTTPTASEIRRVQLAAIRRAKHSIYLHHAYFSDDALLHELLLARRRGVDVRVVMSLHSDRGGLARSSVLTANLMFRNGVRVYIYPGMSHIKAAVYDGWACLGSANANHLSLRFNRETNIATSVPEAVEPLVEALFEADFRASPEMREEFPTQWHDHVWEMLGDYFF